jgi:integrase
VVPVADATTLYLMAQADSGRSVVRRRLDTIAGLLAPGSDAAGFDWSGVTYAEVSMVKAALGRQFKWTTANWHLAALKGVLRTTWQLGMMTTDAYHRAVAIPSFRGTMLPVGRHIEGEEFQRLFAILTDDTSPRGRRDLALFAIARSSGARREELTEIQLDDMNLSALTVVINGKGRKQREVALAPWVRPLVMAWLNVRGTVEGPLFCILRRNGKPSNPPKPITNSGMQDILRRRIAEHGLTPFGWHDIRRTMITDILDAGHDVEAAQKQAGHSDPKQTLRYSRREAKKLQQVARAIPSPFGDGGAK